MTPGVREFLLRVLPWPGDDDPGYVNIHWLVPSPRKPGDMIWVGKPTRDVDGFLRLMDWVAHLPQATDIYMCLSRQATAGKNSKGNPTAARTAAGANALKAIWIDVDVKKPPKGYATIQDALTAISQFIKAAGLPSPSALVGSGGGVHVYWISGRALTPEAWAPYAAGLRALAIKHGLRCDAGVTTDSARVLRPPGTQNHKTTPPRPVRLLGSGADYDFAATLGWLATIAPVQVTAAVSAPFDLTLFPKRALTAPVESLAEGLEREPLLLDIAPIAKGCGFFMEALRTGGRDYAQPMWNLTTLAATFMEHGHTLAHRMGNKHPGYTPASTDALWDRKSKERKDRGLGWPSCSAVQAAGWASCAACPHNGKIRSPLNLGTPTPPAPSPAAPFAAITAATSAGGQPPANMLPAGFAYNQDGLISKVIALPGMKDQPPTIEHLELFTSWLSSPWAQSHPDALNFTTTVDKGNTRQVSVLLEHMLAGTELHRALTRQGVKPWPPHKKFLEEFMVAWLTKLHNAQQATVTPPFGWLELNGKRCGFVYGGVIMKDDGSEPPSGFSDRVLRDLYMPKGELDPWFTACKMITDQKRADIQAIVAMSFASPLMAFTGQYSCIMSAFSGGSGVGKSTAVNVGTAVWGHPKKIKESFKTTSNSMIEKAGQTRHLPLYWDEVSDKDKMKNVFTAMFQLTEGVNQGRLRIDITQRDRTDWQNLMAVCSNSSFGDFVVNEQKQTNAGLYRIFEFQCFRAKPGAPGIISPLDAARMVAELENNYGTMGLKYAKLLATNIPAVGKMTYDCGRWFETKLQTTREERFWVAMCASLLAGATLANSLGASFDLELLRDFLVKTFVEMRSRVMSENVAGGSSLNTEELLTGFLKRYIQETLWTDFSNKQMNVKGKAGIPRVVRVIHGPNMGNIKAIQIHWAVADRLLRIARTPFNAHLHENNASPRLVLESLAQDFGATLDYGTLSAGTPYVTTRERLIYIPVLPNSPLEELMYAHGRTDADPGTVSGVAAAPSNGADPSTGRPDVPQG